MILAGDTQKAQQIYAGIAQKDAKDTTSRLAMGRIALREKRYDDAIDLCRQVLQREGKAMEAFRIRQG